MKAGSIKLSQGYGSHHMKFKAVANADDTFSLLASSRQALRNQTKTEKEGFYQYTAASDSKHIVELEEGKAARVLFEFQQKQQGSGKQGVNISKVKRQWCGVSWETQECMRL